MEKSGLHFDGNFKNDDEVHQFIVDSLPQYPPTVHEQITAFVQGQNSALAPEFEALCDGSPHVQEVIEAIMVVSLQEVRRTMQGLEEEFQNVDHQIDAFIYCVAPDLPAEERSLVTRYIHSKALKMPASILEEQYVFALCAQHPDIRDIVHYFSGTLDEKTLIERYGEKIWGKEDGAGHETDD